MFPDSQFKMEEYQFLPFRRDRNNRGDEKIAFVIEGIIINRLKSQETKVSETIFLELTISSKTRQIAFAYRRSNSKIVRVFLQKHLIHLNKAIDDYKNIVLVGDFT